jgi:hypothetical protein
VHKRGWKALYRYWQGYWFLMVRKERERRNLLGERTHLSCAKVEPTDDSIRSSKPQWSEKHHWNGSGNTQLLSYLLDQVVSVSCGQYCLSGRTSTYQASIANWTCSTDKTGLDDLIPRNNSLLCMCARVQVKHLVSAHEQITSSNLRKIISKSLQIFKIKSYPSLNTTISSTMMHTNQLYRT